MDCIENILEKGEIAHFSTMSSWHFSFFLQCVKMSIYGGKG